MALFRRSSEKASQKVGSSRIWRSCQCISQASRRRTRSISRLPAHQLRFYRGNSFCRVSASVSHSLFPVPSMVAECAVICSYAAIASGHFRAHHHHQGQARPAQGKLVPRPLPHARANASGSSQENLASKRQSRNGSGSRLPRANCISKRLPQNASVFGSYRANLTKRSRMRVQMSLGPAL